MAATATKTKRNLSKARKTLITNVSKANDTLIETTDGFIDEALVTGEKWQKLLSKTLRNSKPLITRQINIFFDGLETVQDQMVTGNKRIKKLTGIDSLKVAEKAQDRVKENTDKIINLVQGTAEKAEKSAAKAETKAKATVKKARKKVRKAVKKAS